MSFYGDVFLPDNKYILSRHTQGTIFIGAGQQSVSINNLVTNNISVTSLIYGNSVFGNVTVGTTLSVLGDLRIKNMRPFNDALDNPNDPSQSLRVSGKVINIGVPDSLVYINGTTTYMFMTQQNIYDPMWVLNAQYPMPFQYGNDCGIQINSISGPGYIKTNQDGTQFLIKAPQSNLIGYISTQDTSNNMSVSGTANLNNVKIASNLLVSGTTTLYNLGMNNLRATGNSIIYGNTSLGSNLSVGGSAYIQRSLTTIGDVTMTSDLTVWQNTRLQSNLFVDKDTNIKGNTTIQSNLNVSGNSVINGYNTVVSGFNVSGPSFFNSNVLMKADLNVLGNTTYESPTLFKSSIAVNDTSTLYGPVAINNTLFVGRSSILNGITDTSYLNVSGDSKLSGLLVNKNATFLSNLYVSGNTNLKYLSLNTIDNVEDMLLSKANITSLSNYYSKSEIDAFDYLPKYDATQIYATKTDISVFQASPTTFTDLTINNSLNVSGLTNILGDFNVTGQSNFEILTTNYFNAYRQSTLYGPTLITNCLNVCGTTDLHDTIIDGQLTVSGIVNLNNQINVSSLTVNNDTILNNTTIEFANLRSGATIDGPVTINSNTTINGDTNLGNLNVNSIIVNNDTIVNNINAANLFSSGVSLLTDVNVMGALNVNNSATFTSLLTVALDVEGETVLQNVTTNGNLIVNGDQQITGVLNVNSDVNIDGPVKLSGNIISPLTVLGVTNINAPFLNMMNFNVFSDSIITLTPEQWINGYIGISISDSVIINLPSANDIISLLNFPTQNVCFTTYINHQLGYNNTISLVTNNSGSNTDLYDGYGYSNPVNDVIVFNTGTIDPVGKYSYQFITRIDSLSSISIFKVISSKAD